MDHFRSICPSHDWSGHEQPSPARHHRRHRHPRSVLRARPSRDRDAAVQVRRTEPVWARIAAARLRGPLGRRRPATELQPRPLRRLRCDPMGNCADLQRDLGTTQEGHRPVALTGLCPF